MHCTVSINQSTSLMQSNMAERSSDQSLRARQQTSRDGGQVFRYGGSDLRGKDHFISTQEWKGKKKVGDEPRPRLPAHLVSLRRKSFTVYVSNFLSGFQKLSWPYSWFFSSGWQSFRSEKRLCLRSLQIYRGGRQSGSRGIREVLGREGKS